MIFLGKGDLRLYGHRISFVQGRFETHDPGLQAELIRRGYTVEDQDGTPYAEQLLEIPPFDFTEEPPEEKPKPKRLGRPRKEK